MKTRIATAISVIGVLTAGTAAAMVNTQIFESQPTVSDESSAMLAPQPTTVGLSLDPESTSTTTGINPGTGSLTEFVIGEAGVVTVDVIDGQLRIVAASAFDGWTITEQEEKLDEDRVEVYFTSGSITVEFDADYIDGRIVPDIDSQQVTVVPSNGGTDTTSPSAPASTSPTYDDDEDDDHDDDDHDDDDDDDDADEYEDRDEDDEYEEHDEDDDDD